MNNLKFGPNYEGGTFTNFFIFINKNIINKINIKINKLYIYILLKFNN